MTTEELKRYFLDAYEIEKAKYAAESVLRETDVTYFPDIWDNVNCSYDLQEVNKKEKRSKLGKKMIIYAICAIILGSVIMGAGATGFGAFVIFTSVPCIYGGPALCFFNRGYKQMKKTIEEIDEKNKEIASWNDEQIDLAQKQTEVAKKTSEELKGVLNKIERRRFVFYGNNVIHPKYRDFIAVSTILGYLDTGRCTTLEGPDGAYNLYEDEIRKDAIISKLDQINQKLDQIIVNQYYLYNAVNSLESAISNTTKAINESTEKLDRIAASQAVTAFEVSMSNVLQLDRKYNS